MWALGWILRSLLACHSFSRHHPYQRAIGAEHHDRSRLQPSLAYRWDAFLWMEEGRWRGTEIVGEWKEDRLWEGFLYYGRGGFYVVVVLQLLQYYARFPLSPPSLTSVCPPVFSPTLLNVFAVFCNTGINWMSAYQTGELEGFCMCITSPPK